MQTPSDLACPFSGQYPGAWAQARGTAGDFHENPRHRAGTLLESRAQTNGSRGMKTYSHSGAIGMIILAALLAAPVSSRAQSVVRIGMTAADIPRTLGQPDQGFEGNRFTGNTMYEGLTTWDLSSADKASVVIPGLASEWAVDANDKTKWIFKLRSGVKFHDGSDFDADAVVWNAEKVLKQDAAHFDPSQVGVTATRMPALRSARAIDKTTVELTTAIPDALLPINLTNLYMASPAHWKKLHDAVPAT